MSARIRDPNKDKAFADVLTKFNNHFADEVKEMQAVNIAPAPENINTAKIRALLLVIADMKIEIDNLKKPRLLT